MDKYNIINNSDIIIKEFIEYDIDNMNFSDIAKIRRSGVYILYRDDNKRYIGSSYNVGGTIRNHSYKWYDEIKYGKINRIEIFITQGRSDSRMLEKFLIIELNPELNFCGERGKLQIR